MSFPEFFDAIPGIVLRDPLAELLGAAQDGLIEYRYADAVRLAGHSCPTVAGAWLATTRALRALYGSEVPERGAVRVDFAQPQDAGVTGVIAGVTGLITGAAGEGGFKGLGGRFARRDLLFFAVDGFDGIRFTRRDGKGAVVAGTDLSSVGADPRMGEVMPRVAQGIANGEERALFAKLWQERVRRILIDHHDDPALVSIERV